MTFKGSVYEGIIDILRSIIVEKGKLRQFKAQYKTYVLQRDLQEADKMSIIINTQTNLVNELELIKDSILKKVDEISSQMNDIEYNIFVKKFVQGKSNQDIMDEIGIAKSTLYRHFDAIYKFLDSTYYKKVFLDVLKIEETNENEEEV